MKVDRKYLIEMITEVLSENEDGEFQKLMDLATDENEGSGIQALEMYEFFDLTEKQIRTLYNVVLYNALEHNIEDLPEVLQMRPPEYTDEEMEVHRKMAYEKIVTKSETPERLLKAMNFDFHNEFTKVYGVTPPRSIEFDFRKPPAPAGVGYYHEDGLYLEIPTAGGGFIMFTFTMLGDHKTVPTDPMIYLRNKGGDEVWMDINSKGGLRYDTDQGETGMSKEEVPDLIRKHMGYATTEPVKEWPELPLGSAAPVRESIDRNYLFQLINEVLREDEDDMDIEKKIDDFIASEDIASLNSGLNILDTLEMSGLVDEDQAKALKKKMADSIVSNKLVLTNTGESYDFINSEEFTSSFSEDELAKYKSTLFSELVEKKDLADVVKMVLGKDASNLDIDGYDGNPFSGMVEITGFKDQEKIDEIIERFQDISGKKDFAAFSGSDEPMIIVGDRAYITANFSKLSQDLFSYKAKAIPYVDRDYDLESEDGDGNPYRVEYSPLLEKGPAEFTITTKYTTSENWRLIITFNDGWDGYLQVDYKTRAGVYLIMLNQHDKRYTDGKSTYPFLIDSDGEISAFSKDQMLAKVKEITGIDLTDVGPSQYDRDLMKEEDEDDDSDFLEKLFSLVASGNLEQAFDLADSLGMEKELFERIVNDENNNELEHGLTKEIPDETTVEMVEFAIKHPALKDGYKEFFSNTEFTTPTSYNSNKKSWDTVTDFEIYRKAALLVFKNILKRYDQFSALNEENFGRESRGDELLQEGWKDQWPNEFGYLLGKITSSVGDKPDIFAEALVKIFYKVGRLQYLMPIKFLRSLKYKVIMYADKGIQEQKKKVDDIVKGIEYIKNEPTAIDYDQEDKNKAIKELEMSLATEQEILDKFEEFKGLADDPFYFGRERRKEVQKQGRAARAANPNDILPPMRVSNKLIKSLRKQLTKWRDKNVMNTPVYPYIGYALTDFTRSIQSQEDWAYEKTFEGDLATLIQFIKGLRGNQEDLGKKLMSIVNKGKDLKETEFIEEINKFIDEGRQIEFVDCKDAGPNDPCVFLRLDNGMFWHSTSVDYCEITQSKMANCGAASDPTGILYNLMSNEGGVNRYYVTLEYSKSKDKVIQVLGKANTLPKEKYWSAITKFFDAVGNPILDKDAFMHMYNDVEDEMTKEELDRKIQEFVEGIGARMVPPPAIDSWKSMREQIRGGYYSDTVEDQPFGGPRVNLFRAAILHGRDDGNKAAMMLNIKMIVQTMKGRMSGDANLFQQERKKLNEYAKSGELKKEILDFAVPEKFLDSQREIHLKYSRSSDVKATMRSNGSIVIQVSFIFGIRTEPWTEERGEYLVENFNQLTKDTVNRLERVGLSTVFAVTPERAAEVYPEEAKRLADINDILDDLGLDEGKKKMKLDRNYLTSLILEVLNEESLSGKFSTLENANQTLNLYIDAGMLPEPVKMEVNEQWGSIYIKFNSNEELQQLIDLLDEDGVTQQLGTRAETPAYFVHKALVNKRKQFYRSDEEPPKPPPATGLTLKF